MSSNVIEGIFFGALVMWVCWLWWFQITSNRRIAELEKRNKDLVNTSVSAISSKTDVFTPTPLVKVPAKNRTFWDDPPLKVN